MNTIDTTTMTDAEHAAWARSLGVDTAALPALAAMSDAERDGWARAEALADVRANLPGWLGVDAERMLCHGYPRESVIEGWTFDTWVAGIASRAEAAAVARAFAANPHEFRVAHGATGIGIVGAVGRGKTSLATCIGWGLCGRGDAPGGAESLFVTWLNLLQQCYDAIGRRDLAGAMVAREGSGVGRVLRRYADAEVLVLDDLGDPDQDRPEPPFVRKVMREVLWPRYDKCAPTVVTTNCRQEDLARLFGDAVASRLYAMLRWVVLGGDDMRRVRRAA